METIDFRTVMIRAAITILETVIRDTEKPSMETPKTEAVKLQDIAQCFDCHRTFFNVGETLRKAAANTWFCSKCDKERKPKETGPVYPVE